jgi:hypothetical protein
MYIYDFVPKPRQNELDKVLYADGYITSPITVTYSQLIERFGPPTSNGDQYYNDAEWVADTPNGLTMIHNHKNGKTFCGTKGTSTKDITYWIVRGVSPEAIGWIKRALGIPV